MNKKQIIFLLLILAISNLSYLIIKYKYNEYILETRLEAYRQDNDNKKDQINAGLEKLTMLDTNASKDKRLKQEKSMINSGEVLIAITNEERYNKFSKDLDFIKEFSEQKEQKIEDTMNNLEKWAYFIFNKDIRK